MATTAKAQEIMNNLKSELSKRFSTLAISAGSDSSGNPTLLVGAASAGLAGAFILCKPVDYPNSYNIIGQVAQVYTPHVLQLCMEADADANGLINSYAQAAQFEMALALRGTKMELYVSPHGTVPSAAALTTGNLVLEFYDDIYQPLLADQ